MALNLWTTGGASGVNYNPLPTGYNASNRCNGMSNGDYVITFKAKSASYANLTVADGAYLYVSQVCNLTPNYQTFTIPFTLKGNANLYLYDANSKGDIMINGVSLVRQPLPSYTINGLDGFLSGNWSIQNNAVVIDDKTITYLPNSIYSSAGRIKIPALPNTVYTVSGGQCSGNGAFIGVEFWTGTGAGDTLISNQNMATNSLIETVTTPSNCYCINIVLTNRVSSGWTQCTYKNIMLNLGTLPAPYEPKRSAGAVMKQPNIVGTANLMPDFSQWTLSGSAQVVNDQLVLNAYGDAAYSPLIPLHFYSGSLYFSADFYSDQTTNGTNFAGQGGYYVSTQYYVDSKASINAVNNSGNTTNGHAAAVPTGTWLNRAGTQFSAGYGINYVRYEIQSSSTWTAPSYKVRNPMLNLIGSYSPFVPYNGVQMNKAPARPPKNFIPVNAYSVTGINYAATTGSDITINNGALNRLSTGLISVNSGTTYTYWITGLNSSNYQLYVVEGDSSNLGTAHYGWTGSSITFTTQSNTKNVRLMISHADNSNMSLSELPNLQVQLEQSLTATNFAPYGSKLWPATTGMKFDGSKSSVNVPHSSNVTDIDLSVTFQFNNVFKNTYQQIWEYGNGNGTYLAIRNDNTLFVSISTTSGQKAAGSGYVITPNTVYTVRLVRHSSDGIVYLYVNGNLVWTDSVDFTGTIQQPSTIWSVIGALSTGDTTYNFNGIIYNISLNGFFSYDFTNPNTIIGNTVLSGVKQNLLPDFESGKWFFSASGDATVLGKNFLHNDVSGVYHTSYVKMLVTPNTKYMILFGSFYATNGNGNTFWKLYQYDNNGVNVATYGSTNILTYTFTTTATTTVLDFEIGSESISSGKIEIYKPVLIQPDGSEGTINGTPLMLLKPAKRVLYNKR